MSKSTNEIILKWYLNKNKKDDAHPDDINVDSPLYNDVDNMLEPNRKLIRNDYSDEPEDGFNATEYGSNMNVVKWIKHFFNIEERELK